MARQLRTYRVSLVNNKEHIQLITQQRSGAEAATYALRIYPGPAPSAPSPSTPTALDGLLALLQRQDRRRSQVLSAMRKQSCQRKAAA